MPQDELISKYIVQWIVAIIFTTICVVTDLRERRIPNVITLPMILIGILYMGIFNGWSGLGASILGMFLISFPYVIVFALGGMGGGDVKLMAAIGAWLGPAIGVWVLLMTVLSGLIITVIAAALYGRIRDLPYTMLAVAFRIRGNIPNMLGKMKTESDAGNPAPPLQQEGQKPLWIPYAPAILVGLISGGLLWAVYGDM